MTDNRETIEMLKMLKAQALKSHNDTAVLEVKIDSFNFVLDEAIKALEQEPCDMKQRVEKEYLYESLCEDLKKANAEIKRLSEPFEDAISRQAVDELSKELVHTTRDKADFLCNFWEGLQKLPSVTSKEKTGHWKPIEYDGYADGYPVWDVWECSKCGGEHNGDKESLTAFCPYCGTKMIEPQESEE